MKAAQTNKKLKPDTSRMKTLTCNVEWDVGHVTKSADGAVIIKGYANTVDKDRVGDVVLPEAFQSSLKTYMDNPVLLYQHDWDKPIGTVTSAEITDKGLYVTAKLSNAKDVDDVRTKILEGALKTFSIGYNEIDATMDEKSKTNYVKDIELLEISVVTIPANANSKFQVVTEAKTEGEGDEKVMDMGLIKFIAEAISQIDVAKEPITDDFIKELTVIYNDQKTKETEGKSFAPWKAKALKEKGYTQEEVDFYQSSLHEQAQLLLSAAQRLQSAAEAFAADPDGDNMAAVREACWDVSRNGYECDTYSMNLQSAAYQGMKPSEGGGEEKPAAEGGEAEGKSFKKKSASQHEQDHAQRTHDSSLTMSTKCMKDLKTAHEGAMKDYSGSNMKALDKAHGAFQRSLEEVKRSKESLDSMKKTPNDGDGGKEEPTEDTKPQGEENE